MVQFGGMILYVLDTLDDFGVFECIFAAWGWRHTQKAAAAEAEAEAKQEEEAKAGGLLRTDTRPTLNLPLLRLHHPRVCMSIAPRVSRAPILGRVLVLNGSAVRGSWRPRAQ